MSRYSAAIQAEYQVEVHRVKLRAVPNRLTKLAFEFRNKLQRDNRAAVAALIESGPTPAIHGVARWRLLDLCQWLWDERQVSVAKQTLGRELRAMNCRKLSARPRHHAQAADAIELSKRVSPAA